MSSSSPSFSMCQCKINVILFSSPISSQASKMTKSISRFFLQHPANPDLLYIIFFCHSQVKNTISCEKKNVLLIFRSIKTFSFPQLTITILLCLIFASKFYLVGWMSLMMIMTVDPSTSVLYVCSTQVMKGQGKELDEPAPVNKPMVSLSIGMITIIINTQTHITMIIITIITWNTLQSNNTLKYDGTGTWEYLQDLVLNFGNLPFICTNMSYYI